MERVQWNQEQMIAELRDLQEKRIFSAEEVREIFKKRSAFETALVRRSPQKRDFLAYAEYEMNLEQLRRLRVKKMSEFAGALLSSFHRSDEQHSLKEIEKQHSLSDHSIVQRQFTIFERATRKFKGDVRLWVQYIDTAKREHASQLAGRVCAQCVISHAIRTAH